MCLAGLVLLIALKGSDTAADLKHAASDVRVAFGEDCEVLLLREIHAARRTVCVATFIITRKNIIEALGQAVTRGVDVRIKYDAESAGGWLPMKKAIDHMKRKGVRCTAIHMDEGGGRMHHKFMVIDGQSVLTGSYNFTTAATTENYENLIKIESPSLAAAFTKEFDRIRSE